MVEGRDWGASVAMAESRPTPRGEKKGEQRVPEFSYQPNATRRLRHYPNQLDIPQSAVRKCCSTNSSVSCTAASLVLSRGVVDDADSSSSSSSSSAVEQATRSITAHECGCERMWTRSLRSGVERFACRSRAALVPTGSAPTPLQCVNADASSLMASSHFYSTLSPLVLSYLSYHPTWRLHSASFLCHVRLPCALRLLSVADAISCSAFPSPIPLSPQSGA